MERVNLFYDLAGMIDIRLTEMGISDEHDIIRGSVNSEDSNLGALAPDVCKA